MQSPRKKTQTLPSELPGVESWACPQDKEGFLEKEMGKKGGTFKGKEDGRGSGRASECLGDVRQRRVKLLKGKPPYKSWEGRYFAALRNQEVSKGVTVSAD